VLLFPEQTVVPPEIAAELQEFPLFIIPDVVVPNLVEFLLVALEPLPPHEVAA
jgi:hypothetical protein